MKYAIWGCGIRGKMLLSCLDKSLIEFFIDNNPNLIGTQYEGINIISFQTYLDMHYDCFIIQSSTAWRNEIITLLKQNNISHYFDLTRCPTELPGYEEELPFEEMLSNTIKLDCCSSVALVGINLFSLLLYDYITCKEEFKVYFVFLPEQEALINEILRRDSSYIFISMEMAKAQGIKLLMTDRIIAKRRKVDFGLSEDFYRFPYLSKYKGKFSDMKKFRNIHQGKRCFVIGNGPSLNIEDLDKLHINREISFAVNFIYKSFQLTHWRPDYFFWFDTGMTTKILDEIDCMDVENKFIGCRKASILDNSNCKSVCFYRSYGEDYGEEGPDFSNDVNYGVYYGYTVLYDCLQFAVYMGFKEIYIVGADCNYPHNGTSEDYFLSDYNTDFEIPSYLQRDPNVGREPNDSLPTNKFIVAFQSAKDYADEHGIKIFNATRGGKLEVFPRVDFDSLFN